MTYLELLAICLLPPVVGLALWSRARNVAPVTSLIHQLAALAGLILLALVATVPWDAALIAHHTWTYPHGLRLGWLLGVPVEELLFMIGQPLLVGLWLRCCPVARPQPLTHVRAARWWPASVWCALAVGGVALVLANPRATYLGLLLAWAGPLLAVQWAVGGDRLWSRRRLLATAVLVPSIFLCLVDRSALALDLWQLSPTRTTGLRLLGLPVEEIVFFLLTDLLVVGGLLLATDPQVWRRLRSVVRLRSSGKGTYPPVPAFETAGASGAAGAATPRSVLAPWPLVRVAPDAARSCTDSPMISRVLLHRSRKEAVLELSAGTDSPEQLATVSAWLASFGIEHVSVRVRPTKQVVAPSPGPAA